MDITKLNIEESDTPPNSEGIISIHHLPCKLDHDGDAEIEEYFYSTIQPRNTNKSDENSINPNDNTTPSLQHTLHMASMRGRPLKGRVVNLPEDAVGVVFDAGSNSDRWQTVETFHTVMDWALDADPTQESTVMQNAISWLALSKAVCVCMSTFEFIP